MRLWNYALPALLVMGLVGCGSSNNNNTPDQPQEPVIDSTDKSQCNNPSIPATTSIERSWYNTYQSKHFHFITSLTIRRNSVTVTNLCQLAGGGGYARISVTVPSSYSANQLTIIKSDSKSTRVGSLNCTASVTAATMGYELQRSCLKFKMGRDEHILTALAPPELN